MQLSDCSKGNDGKKNNNGEFKDCLLQLEIIKNLIPKHNCKRGAIKDVNESFKAFGKNKKVGTYLRIRMQYVELSVYLLGYSAKYLVKC